MLICTPNSATNCRVLQMCPIWYFSCLAREEMLLKSRSPVLADEAGRQTDRQTELGWYKYAELRRQGLPVTVLQLPDEESAIGFLWSNQAGQPG